MEATTVVSKEITSEALSATTESLKSRGAGAGIPEKYHAEGLLSDFIRSVLKVQHIHRGRLTCIFTVKPSLCNRYNSLHGGAVGTIAETVAVACARTVVSKEKELFLGELSASYIAAAVKNSEVILDASVVRSGRNVTVVAIQFKLKDSERLVYMCRVTFYNTPVASL